MRFVVAANFGAEAGMSTQTLPFFYRFSMSRRGGLTAVVLMLCIALALVAALMMRLPYFEIRRVVIEGDTKHSDMLALKANAGAGLVNNFWSLKSRDLQTYFESLPWIRKAVIRRQFPDTVRVSLEEHQPAAIWQGDLENSYVNNFGEIFQADSDNKAEDLPVFKSKVEQSVRVMSMYVALNQLVQSMAHSSVVEIELSKGGLWRMVVAPNTAIELGRGTEDELQERLRKFFLTYRQALALNSGNALQALSDVDLRYQRGFSVKVRNSANVIAVN